MDKRSLENYLLSHCSSPQTLTAEAVDMLSTLVMVYQEEELRSALLLMKQVATKADSSEEAQALRKANPLIEELWKAVRASREASPVQGSLPLLPPVPSSILLNGTGLPRIDHQVPVPIYDEVSFSKHFEEHVQGKSFHIQKANNDWRVGYHFENIMGKFQEGSTKGDFGQLEAKTLKEGKKDLTLFTMTFPTKKELYHKLCGSEACVRTELYLPTTKQWHQEWELGMKLEPDFLSIVGRNSTTGEELPARYYGWNLQALLSRLEAKMGSTALVRYTLTDEGELTFTSVSFLSLTATKFISLLKAGVVEVRLSLSEKNKPADRVDFRCLDARQLF